MMNVIYILGMNRTNVRKIVFSTCVSCRQNKRIYCKGMCKTCYNKQLVPQRWSRISDGCLNCGTSERPHSRRGLCSRCANIRPDSGVLCACGCGSETVSYRGKPKKFLRGHWLRVQKDGSKFQEAHKKAFTGKNNPQYGKFGKDHPAYGHETKPEVRELRRQTRLNFMSKRGKVTDIEEILFNMLNELKIDHIPQKLMYGKFTVDEFVPQYNLVIEAFGSYWHGDTRRFPNPSEMQIKNSHRDRSKLKYLVSCGHRVLILREIDLKRSPDLCKEEILLAIENSFLPFVQDSFEREPLYGLLAHLKLSRR